MACTMFENLVGVSTRTMFEHWKKNTHQREMTLRPYRPNSPFCYRELGIRWSSSGYPCQVVFLSFKSPCTVYPYMYSSVPFSHPCLVWRKQRAAPFEAADRSSARSIRRCMVVSFRSVCLTLHKYLLARVRRVSYFAYVSDSSRKACVSLCICI